MSKFNIDLFDPSKNYVIEASAGTGKTFNIVQIVVKIVSLYLKNNPDGDINELINKILIVTYTDKAAGELKSRIRAGLTANFPGKSIDFDNAPIYTIHSFCKATISEFGISAKLPLDLDMVDDEALNDFADRYIRSGDILDVLSAIIALGDEKLTVNPDTVKDYLIKAINKYYLDRNYECDDSIISLDKVEDADELLKFRIECSEANDISELFNDYPKLQFYFEVFSKSDKEKSVKFAQELAEKYRTGFNFNGKTFRNDAKWLTSPSEQEAFDYFFEIKNEKFKTKIEDIILTLFLDDFYKKWQLEKEYNKVQTFDDLIRSVRESVLHEETLLNKLKEKYTYAIIDEFQDTNQKQFDIFKRIFLEDDNHHIVVVGDPKQSIYSFQGADVQVYFKAVKEITQGNEDNKWVLTMNHRSSKAMVKAFNKLFSIEPYKESLSYQECDYRDASKDNALEIDKKEHKSLFDGKDMKAIWVAVDDENKALSNDKFADIAVEQIINCCSLNEKGETRLRVSSDGKPYRNVTFKDFTVLARSSSEMVDIERALKKAGIPYVRYKDSNLYNQRECVHWISLFEAINCDDFTGDNRKKFKKALFTDFFGKTLKEINNEYYNHDDCKEFSLFTEWRLLALDEKWEDLIDDIIINSGIIERMKSLNKIQSLSIYKQIGNHCIDYLSNNHNLKDLIRHLTLLSKNIGEEDEENGSIVEKSTNFDCVQIMTIHASKGLQFPVVISAAGFKGPYTQGKVFTYHDEETGKQLVTTHHSLCGKDEVEEWMRLFYVAYTRAVFLMILPYYEKYGEPGSDKVNGRDFLSKTTQAFIENYRDHYSYVYDNKKGYKALGLEVQKILNVNAQNNEQVIEDESIEEHNEKMKQLVRGLFFKVAIKHSYSTLSHGHEEESIIEDEDIDGVKEGEESVGLSAFDKTSIQIDGIYNPDLTPIDFGPTYPKGAVLGDTLHKIFEVLDFSNYKLNLERIIENCFKNYGFVIKKEWNEPNIKMVNEVMSAKLPVINGNKGIGEYFSLCEISNNDKKAEMEFNFNVINKRLIDYFNGFIDLIFRRGEYYSILDWKSDRLNETFLSYSDKDELKKHVDEAYSIQRVIYSYCLIKWLTNYYPSLSEEEIFNQHFGGIYYVFLRGCNEGSSNGVYAQTWNSWNDLLNAFNKIVKEKIGG